MISDRALALAIERGLLTSEQADALHSLDREVAPPAPEPVDDEQLRFISGFADIFVSIGIVLFLGALAFLMSNGAGSTPMLAGVAACAWLLAEFFTGKRRMALPSILLLVIFVGATFMVSLQVFTALLPATGELPPSLWFVPTPSVAPLACAALVATGMATIHYVRFGVPITVAAGAATLSLLVLAVAAGLLPSLDETGINLAVLACGLAVFAIAMRYDMSDPARETRRADVAFWLHLLAAPLIVHPLLRVFLHGLDGNLSAGAASGVLWVFLALGVVAVVIDRRALLVSGLAYAGAAFWALIKPLGLGNPSIAVSLVVLTLGALVLLLGAAWQPLRRALLRRLPPRLAGRLPHPLMATSS